MLQVRGGIGWAMVKLCFLEIVTDVVRHHYHSKNIEANVGFHMLPANALAEQEPFQALFGISLAEVHEDQKAYQRVEREFRTRILQNVTFFKALSIPSKIETHHAPRIEVSQFPGDPQREPR